MDSIRVLKGTIIKVRGIPFKLTEDIRVNGNLENLPLVNRESEASDAYDDGGEDIVALPLQV